MKANPQKSHFFIIKCLNLILAIFVIMFIIFNTNGLIERTHVNKTINDFKNRGIYETTVNNIEYYVVRKEFDYEKDCLRTFEIKDNNNIENYIGALGDIIITSRNPLKGIPVISEFIGYFAKNYYVGHATINSSFDGSKIIESEGKEYKAVVENINNWLYLSNCPTIVGLKVKASIDVKQSAVNYCIDKIGSSYSSMFLLNLPNSYYCTDLLSRAYDFSGKNINYDNYATTGNDIIMSDNTFIFFFSEKKIINGNTFYKIYYLENN